jgi:hypothetical protein
MKYQMNMFGIGVGYFFGFSPNPLEKIMRHFSEKSDWDRMAEDWSKIGLDIKNAYEAGQKTNI